MGINKMNKKVIFIFKDFLIIKLNNLISNSIIEERYQFIVNLYLISKKSKLAFLYNIDFMHNIFSKYIPSIKFW